MEIIKGGLRLTFFILFCLIHLNVHFIQENSVKFVYYVN